MGQEPEIGHEVERYGLYIVRLIATHSSGSGGSLLERPGFYPSIGLSEQWQTGVSMFVLTQAGPLLGNFNSMLQEAEDQWIRVCHVLHLHC